MDWENSERWTSVWDLVTHVGDIEQAQINTVLAIAAIWGMSQKIEDSLYLSY